MSKPRFASRRRLRSEILPLVSVAALSFAIVSLFPREAAVLRPLVDGRAERLSAASCAFVTLDSTVEAAALAAARTSWQKGEQKLRRTAELLPAVLPEERPTPAASVACPLRLRFGERIAPRVSLLPPSRAAARPAKILPTEDDAPAPVFSREMMLELR